MAVRSPQDIYARHVSSSRGYPMWTPEPSSQLLSYHSQGLRIGDVGVVVPDNGNFDVFFNLCLPKDCQFHKDVPDGFSPVELSDEDITTIRNAEKTGQILTASSVTKTEDDGGSRTTCPPLAGATRYAFNLSSNEGALLVLPEGADSHDIRNPRTFFEHASRHAATWYRFAEENLGRIISHDAIYVITGFHKARSWGLAGYHDEHGSGDFDAQFLVGAREGGNAVGRCHWETTRNMDWRAGPRDGLGLANQSVFIRGYKIALRSALQGVPQKWISFEPRRSNVRSNQPTSGDSWLDHVWSGVSKTLGISDTGESRTERVRVEIQRIPEILPVFHPSDVINRYILQKEPSAGVALVHDNDWGSILDENLLTLEELVQDKTLTQVLSERYTIILREGVAHLESTTNPATILARRASSSGTYRVNDTKGENKVVQHNPPESLSVVSESEYRCIVSESCSVDLESIPSKFAATPTTKTLTSIESFRLIKIIVISDYICSFCYLCDKILHDAIEACRDLPIRFDVEFRPFTLLNALALPVINVKKVIYRNAYLIERFGKEKTEMTLKAVDEFAQKANLKLAEDSIVCGTILAHRLSAKAYRDGGQDLQQKLNTYLFDACLTKRADISDEDILLDAAVNIGLMNEQEASAFLKSTECLDCVEKMVEAAKAQGITGVPFIIIDGKWAVNGLQPVDCFIQIFRKLARPPVQRKSEA